MPRLPGLGEVIGLLRTQAATLAELPSTVRSLQRAVRALPDAVAAGGETLLVLQQLALRMDRLVDELDPGLQRAATVLGDPVLETVPDTVRRVQSEVLPLLQTLGETQARLATLPGAGLLGQLTGLVTPRPPIPPLVDPPSPSSPSR